MKLSIAFLFISSATAFVPRAPVVRPASPIFMTDTSEAVQKAMEISETKGKTSPEARMAWEYVEELDAANAHQKQRVKEIERKQAAIDALLQKAKEDELAAAQESVIHRDTSEAVRKALEASRVYGKSSPEARMAWEEVEEMDAANSHHKSDGSPRVAKKEIQADTKAEEVKATALAAPCTVEEAIHNAMMLSKAYGKSATETRLAWELVEELEAEDSHKRARFREALEKKAAEESVAAKVEAPKNVLHVDSETAIKAAMEASEKYGKTSAEARIAWELVEEIDATNSHHKTVGSG